MKKIALLGSVAIVAALVMPSQAFAQDSDRHEGWQVGLDVVGVSAAIDYTGGKPDPSWDGVMGGVTLGYDWQVSNFVFGLRGSYAAGDVRAPVEYDGNFIKQRAELTSLATLEARAGVALGDFLFYGTAGLTQADGTIGQDCSRAVVAAAVSPTSHCALNGGPDGYFRDADLQVNGDTFGGGIEYNLTDDVVIDLSYRRTQFDREIVQLGNNGNVVPAPIPPTDPELEEERVTLGFRVRLGRAA